MQSPWYAAQFVVRYLPGFFSSSIPLAYLLRRLGLCNKVMPRRLSKDSLVVNIARCTWSQTMLRTTFWKKYFK